MRASEVKGISALLMEDYDTPDELAKVLINWLDKDRASRTTYAAVMQFGQRDGSVFYQGIGPFPGAKSARNAAMTHPSADMAWKVAVVPLTTPEGLTAQVKTLDAKPVPKPAKGRK